MSGATLRNDSGSADSLRIDQDLNLLKGLTAIGAGPNGAVRLVGAHVGGQLDASDATIRNDTGPALSADRLRVDHDLILSAGFIANGAREGGSVRLIGARIGGQLSVDPAAIEDPDGQPGTLDLDGLVYSGLPAPPSVADWLHVLAHQTRTYAAQPYRHLAAAAQAAGHDGDTRRTLMAQRRDQLDRRAISAHPERAWAKLTGYTLGYGYQPWRALMLLLGVVGIAITLTLSLGAHGGLTQTSGRDLPQRPAPPAHPWNGSGSASTLACR